MCGLLKSGSKSSDRTESERGEKCSEWDSRPTKVVFGPVGGVGVNRKFR